MKPSISFSNVKQLDLERHFNLKAQKQLALFTDWFDFEYIITVEEQAFLQQLIKKHELFLPFYNERQLTAKFIAPLLNRVDFMVGDLKDWYEEAIAYEFDHLKLSGTVDYMVAIGESAPLKPYFFIQEFKSSVPNKHPLTQLLAELLVTIGLNQENKGKGAYIIGQYWTFVILEKKAENRYHYYRSKDFNSLELPDLTQIYINLQAVKHKYCNIPLND